MQTAGTDAVRLLAETDAVLRANLDALRIRLPKTAKLIESPESPHPLALVEGRDGAPTIAWNDASGRLRWLGDTTMPSVSEPAMVEQFDPGNGNVLIFGIAQGTAIHQLTEKLRPHQAIFVIEPEPWRAAAALRLHALQAELRRGRLLLFVGRDAWDHLREFLVESAGYLAPERTLAWPWFSRQDVRTLTERISTTQARVGSEREARLASAEESQPTQPLRVFIGSNSADTRSHRWARRLARAVRDAGGSALCCVPDDPSEMHPAFIEGGIRRLQPTTTILIDCAPAQLAFRIAESPLALVVTHTDALPSWLTKLDAPDVHLFVRTTAQRNIAVSQGFDATKVALLSPGATAERSAAHTDADVPTPANITLVVRSDRVSMNPDDVGLHLGSHQRLWRKAKEWMTRNVDTYHDGRAADALAHAESSINLRIQNDEVRAGLVDRIRRTLGPQVVRESLVRDVVESGVNLRIEGAGWSADERLSQFVAVKSDTVASNHAAVLLSIGTSPYPEDSDLDWLAAGRPAIVRRVDGPHAELTWSRLLEEGYDVTTFTTASELRAAITRLQDNPSTAFANAVAIGDRLRQHHSWRHRLVEMLGQPGIDVAASETQA